MESRCKTQTGRIKWANIYSNQICSCHWIKYSKSNWFRELQSAQWLIYFWSGLCYYLFIMLFSIYNIYFLVWFLQELSAPAVYICICLWSTFPGYLGGAGLEAASNLWHQEGSRGLWLLKKAFLPTLHSRTDVPCCWPDLSSWIDVDFCHTLAKQDLHTGGGF